MHYQISVHSQDVTLLAHVQEKGKLKLLNLLRKITNFYDFFKSSEMNGHFGKKFIPKRNVLFVIFMVMEKRTTLISYATRSTAQEDGRKMEGNSQHVVRHFAGTYIEQITNLGSVNFRCSY